jgi:hypothetical protein
MPIETLSACFASLLDGLFDAGRLLRLLAQLAANSCKGLVQIRFHAFGVTERRIEDGLHITSALVLSGTKTFNARRSCMSQKAFHRPPTCEGSAAYRRGVAPKALPT